MGKGRFVCSCVCVLYGICICYFKGLYLALRDDQAGTGHYFRPRRVNVSLVKLWVLDATRARLSSASSGIFGFLSDLWLLRDDQVATGD